MKNKSKSKIFCVLLLSLLAAQLQAEEMKWLVKDSKEALHHVRGIYDQHAKKCLKRELQNIFRRLYGHQATLIKSQFKRPLIGADRMKLELCQRKENTQIQTCLHASYKMGKGELELQRYLRSNITGKAVNKSHKIKFAVAAYDYELEENTEPYYNSTATYYRFWYEAYYPDFLDLYDKVNYVRFNRYPLVKFRHDPFLECLEEEDVRNYAKRSKQD